MELAGFKDTWLCTLSGPQIWINAENCKKEENQTASLKFCQEMKQQQNKVKNKVVYIPQRGRRKHIDIAHEGTAKRGNTKITPFQ